MKTTAGDWQPIALDVADRMMRSAILETCRAAYMAAKGNEPDDLNQRLADRHQTLLYDVLAAKHDGRGDQLEKMGNGLVRMILLAMRDAAFAPLLDMTWYRAIIIARWADQDLKGARAEVSGIDEDGQPSGPRETERRYKQAVSGRADETKFRTKGVVARGHRLTYAMLEANGFAGLDACIKHFERFGFGRYVCHVLAKELPRLATEKRASDIAQITKIVTSTGVLSRYLQPTTTFILRHEIASDHAAKRALEALAFIETSPHATARFTKDLEAILPKPKRKVSPDVLAWQRHPHWSRIPQRAAAEHGRRLFQRSIYKWIIATEENGDPDNHPLNFIEYDRRYGRRDSMLLLGDPVR